VISYSVRAETAFVVVGAWMAAELLLRLRRGDGPAVAGDWTLYFLWVVQFIGINAAFRLAHAGYGEVGGGVTPVIVGAVVAASGLALRVWAIVVLGRFFRYVVVIQEGHVVVDQGPYHLLRHPSYTGILLILLGIGIALGTWPAIAAALVIPLPGFAARIVVEERALTKALGDQYRDYAARTHRIIPGIL